MPRPKGSTKPPSYRLHAASGQAITRIEGRTHYLGKHDSEASHDKYRRLLAEWYSRGRQGTGCPNDQLTVSQILAGFLNHLTDTNASDAEREKHRVPIRVLRRLFGTTLAKDFGPAKLIAFREELLRMPNKLRPDNRLSRAYINANVKLVVHIFGWAASREMVSGSQLYAMREVRPLAKGRTTAPDRPKVTTVPEDVQRKTIEKLPTMTLRVMVEVQRLTGMRSGELCLMRTCDIDMSGPTWLYRPSKHKTQYKGRDRVIPIGPAAQSLLRPYLRKNLQEFLFSPIRDRREELIARRVKFLDRLRELADEHGVFNTRDAVKDSGVKRSTAVNYLSELKRVGALIQTAGYRVATLADGFTTDRLDDIVFERSLEEMRAIKRAGRKPTRSRRDRSEAYGERYRTAIYWAHVKAAAKAAGVGHWWPHMLRHSFATEVRDKFDLSTAAELLGHSDEKVTLIYAEQSLRKMSEVAAKIG